MHTGGKRKEKGVLRGGERRGEGDRCRRVLLLKTAFSFKGARRQGDEENKKGKKGE